MTWGSPHFKKPPYEFLWYELVWIGMNWQLYIIVKIFKQPPTPWCVFAQGRDAMVKNRKAERFLRSTQCPAGNLYAKVSMESKRITLVEYQWINGIYIYICLVYSTNINWYKSVWNIPFIFLHLVLHSMFVCLLNPCRKTLHFFQLTPSIAQSVG